LARPTEQSEGADTLPKSELNPLVNQLLADNMGRWAEVYFTAPPEKREEAVLELVHELERERTGAGESAQPAVRSEHAKVSREIAPPPSFMVEDRADKAYCRSCGRENPATHQFCGMCGSKLEDSRPQPGAPDADLRASAVRMDSSAHEHFDRAADGGYEADNQSQAPEDMEPASSYYAPNELSLFQSFRAAHPEDDWEYEQAPSKPYRYYIAAVLAIIIGALGYMAWRGAEGTRSGHEASPAPPPSATEAAQPPANNASASPHETAQPETPKKAPETAASNPSLAAAKKPVPPRRTEVARKAPAAEPPAETAPAGQPSADYGNEELTMAQRYLNGSVGRGRDSAEAAKWLWKAMAKHNGAASVLLADLYLKGDGVSKNCDQGRILLDSAARRGIPGAGERLRNLPAFGCH
jgi:TPR repeat protein